MNSLLNKLLHQASTNFCVNLDINKSNKMIIINTYHFTYNLSVLAGLTFAKIY